MNKEIEKAIKKFKECFVSFNLYSDCVADNYATAGDYIEKFWREELEIFANNLLETQALALIEMNKKEGYIKGRQDVMAEKEEQLINHLVDRFLGWRLPDDFHPDAGISFKPTFNDTPEIMQALGLTEPMRHEPVGTNLFTAEQAKEMFRFLLENDDGTSILAELFTQAHIGKYRKALLKNK